MFEFKLFSVQFMINFNIDRVNCESKKHLIIKKTLLLCALYAKFRLRLFLILSLIINKEFDFLLDMVYLFSYLCWNSFDKWIVIYLQNWFGNFCPRIFVRSPNEFLIYFSQTVMEIFCCCCCEREKEIKFEI